LGKGELVGEHRTADAAYIAQTNIRLTTKNLNACSESITRCCIAASTGSNVLDNDAIVRAHLSEPIHGGNHGKKAGPLARSRFCMLHSPYSRADAWLG
jgi:hypothetical protein